MIESKLKKNIEEYKKGKKYKLPWLSSPPVWKGGDIEWEKIILKDLLNKKDKFYTQKRKKSGLNVPKGQV
jgi:hypothetical protein